MLKLKDLAERCDFRIGPLTVSPSRRLLQGPAGSVHLQPLVMQAFLLLLDADGSVVTRDKLFDQCWGGTMVGNESLNRVMARIRQIPSEVAPDLFEIETIPRTGYRITGEILTHLEAQTEPPAERRAMHRPMSRRAITASSVALVAVAASWWAMRSSTDKRFLGLMDEARREVRNAHLNERTARILGQAIAIRPDDAEAWGMLALVRSILAQDADGEPAISGAETAIRNALAIDPREPHALLAMFELQGSTLDWPARDQTLRRIIGIDPTNVLAITELVALLQAAGLNVESWSWNERALKIEPLSADLLGRRALKLWIAGRVPEADKVADQVRALYPRDRGTWWVRFLILALTDRAPAAMAMIQSEPTMMAPPLAALWETCLPALDKRSSESITRARSVCLDAARISGDLAAHSVMILAALKEVDASFAVAEGFLLWRGNVVRHEKRPKDIVHDAAWRIGVQWLFTPPCANIRSDRRFIGLCEGIGLTHYWRHRGVRPDYQVHDVRS